VFSILIQLINIIIVIIYACVYSVLLSMIFYLISKFSKTSFFQEVIKNKKIYFTFFSIFFSIVFLLYHYSYSRDHGFGDNYKIPIGNKYFVIQIDGAETHFENSKTKGNGEDFYIQKFRVINKKLCAKLFSISSVNCEDCYLVFDIELEKQFIFKSSLEYEKYANDNQLPMESAFLEFTENYNDHWSNNSKWYLP
jgi:hypothetical protein